MKILIVGLTNSVHVAHWVNLFDNKKRFYLFPSIDYGESHSDLQRGMVFHTFFSLRRNHNHAFKFGIPVPSAIMSDFFIKLLSKVFPDYQKIYLRLIMLFLKPDVIHSIGIQAAMLVLHIKTNKKFTHYPSWIHTNWGHDFYFMERLKEYQKPLNLILNLSNYYTCECNRDLILARQKTHRKELSSQVFPTLAGINLSYINKFRWKIKSSERTIIMVKGYEHSFGRSLFALRAISQCSDILKRFTIIVYAVTNRDVFIAARFLAANTGLKVQCIPDYQSQQSILQLHCRARISIGLSISDGISSSFLEAIAAGSFPIQSNSSCADEWVVHGKTGFLVDAENTNEVEQAIRIAIADNPLVDRAAIQNWKVVLKRLNPENHLIRAEELYQRYNRRP